MYAVCTNLNRQKNDQVALDKKQKQQQKTGGDIVREEKVCAGD
jgi:hypothetical protein